MNGFGNFLDDLTNLIFSIIFGIAGFAIFVYLLSKILEGIKLSDWTKLVIVAWFFYVLILIFYYSNPKSYDKPINSENQQKSSGIIKITPNSATEPEPVIKPKPEIKPIIEKPLLFLPVTWISLTFILIVIIYLDYKRLNIKKITPPNHT